MATLRGADTGTFSFSLTRVLSAPDTWLRGVSGPPAAPHAGQSEKAHRPSQRGPRPDSQLRPHCRGLPRAPTLSSGPPARPASGQRPSPAPCACGTPCVLASPRVGAVWGVPDLTGDRAGAAQGHVRTHMCARARMLAECTHTPANTSRAHARGPSGGTRACTRTHMLVHACTRVLQEARGCSVSTECLLGETCAPPLPGDSAVLEPWHRYETAVPV